jgi:hypothetical protein
VEGCSWVLYSFLSLVEYSYSNVVDELRLRTLCERRNYLSALVFFIFVYISFSVCPLLVDDFGLFEFICGITEIFLCPVSVVYAEIVLPGTYQLLMSVETLMCLEKKSVSPRRSYISQYTFSCTLYKAAEGVCMC